jgi:hypothetical protein
VFQSVNPGVQFSILISDGAYSVSWDAPGIPTVLLSASHANFSVPGAFGYQANVASHSTSGAPWAMTQVRAFALTGSVGDIGGSLDFSFQSYPRRRTFRGTPSYFDYDHAAEFRGNQPRIPAVGSPMATGPARVVVLSGEVSNFKGQDPIGVRLSVRERFSYLR